MSSQESHSNKKESESNFGSKLGKNHYKPLLNYTFKRIIHCLTILQGIMTIYFLIMYSQSIINQQIIDFFLYFSIIVFICYGFFIIGIHFLEKPRIEKITPEPIEILEEIPKIKAEIPEDYLQGKTLQIYWYFFTHRHAGVREIQKALNLSSSGTVSYQISKLLKAGIISKDDEEGKYSLNEEVKIGVLRLFFRIGSRTIPKISLYLIFYSFGFIIFLILIMIQGLHFFYDPINLLLLFFLILGTVIFVLESYKIWKLKPIK
ncbi:MAG: winged helix-turn-helix domain-containing protein [Promethearchaeota archaeon]